MSEVGSVTQWFARSTPSLAEVIPVAITAGAQIVLSASFLVHS